MTRFKARLTLFFIWVGITAVYVALFLGTSLKRGILFEQALEAVWKILYVLVPVLMAFISFWFIPRVGRKPADEPDLDLAQTWAMFVATILVHVIVLAVFVFAVVMPDFGYPDQQKSYSDRVDGGMKILLLLSSLAVGPLGYVLGQQVASPKVPKVHSRPAAPPPL
jgi:hypothetical protein